MKRVLVAVGLSVAVCAFGLWVGGKLDWVIYAHGRVAFTADQTVEHYGPAKQLGGLERLNLGFRSDGSTAKVLLQLRWRGEEGLKARHVIDLRRREEFTIYPEIGSISSTPVSTKEVEIYSRRPDPSCLARDPFRSAPMVDPSPDPQAMFGQRVIKLVSERIDSKVKTVVIQWLAPELDCFALKRVSTRYDLEGNLLAENVHTVTALRLGEPDDAMFELTPGMKERSPSQIRAEVARLLKDSPVEQAEEPGLALQDAAYNRRRGVGK